MNHFTKPEMEVIKFTEEDVLTASTCKSYLCADYGSECTSKKYCDGYEACLTDD